MMLKKLKILILEDLPPDAELICRELKTAEISCVTRIVNCKTDYIRALNEFSPDIILSDHTLPSFSSVEALTLAIEKLPKIPLIIVAGTISEEFAVKIMKEGAWDYVLKNKLKNLPDAIKKAIDKFEYEKLRQKFLYDLILNEAYMEEAERIAHYGSWEVDVIGRKLKLSKEAYIILGYAHRESAAFFENILKTVHPDEHLHVRLIIDQVVNQSDTEVFKENFRLVDKEGRCRIIKTEFVLKHNSQGKLIKVNGFIQNVTDSVSLEEKLLESEERFYSLKA